MNEEINQTKQNNHKKSQNSFLADYICKKYGNIETIEFLDLSSK